VGVVSQTSGTARFGLQAQPCAKPHRVLGYRAVQVRDFILTYNAAHGISPSYDEIRDSLGLCSNGDVHRIIVSLEWRGIVSRNVEKWGKRGQRVIKLVNR
jgi:SOS-response transcriptional repressor LexA